jgi:uncharacterized spore protein YtfJ
MAKQTAESMGFPSGGSKGDNRPIVRRRPMGGGTTKGLGGSKPEKPAK